ncbi:E3 ubiquitin-protein ligase TRAIP-like [Spea bombifrons]|uniref:E3 ubiquitin-protein ligase TRAIP-like n=1 Tax=Spea bombifrons TaxID=233779 RepID=UPI00234BA2ED|nr:E3 ubiquitin-protein ligase TRAIP-like [Spea bombifrons]
MPLWATCSICMDYLDNSCDVAAICCGHTFHQKCIMQWFCTSPKVSCPRCRKELKSSKCFLEKLYFDVGEQDGPALDPESLKREVDQLTSQLQEQQQRIEEQQRELEANMEELERYRREIQSGKNIETLLESQTVEVQMVVTQMGTGPEAFLDLASYSLAITKDYNELKEEHKASEEMIEHLKSELNISNERAQSVVIEYEKLREEQNTTWNSLITIQKELAVNRNDVKNAEEVIVSVGKKAEPLQEPFISQPPSEGAINCLLYNNLAPPGLQRSNLCLADDILRKTVTPPTTTKAATRPEESERLLFFGLRQPKLGSPG